MRGERRIYPQGIKVGHLHVSQQLLSMIVPILSTGTSYATVS